MPELRQNMATKEWVIIASERAKRPHEFATPSGTGITEHPPWEAHCPFCPGNEETDLEVLRLPGEGPWRVRVVGNRYPALQREGERFQQVEGVRRRISGVGYHEVVVESPLHNTCPALESAEQMALVLEAFQRRGQAIAQDSRVEHVIYFKNHGERAGASLVHPHTQLIGVPVVPLNVRTRMDEARRYHDNMGRCVHCQMLEEELAHGERVVLESAHFVAFIPYAANSPFHTWVFPRRHCSSFLEATAAEVADLGWLLQRVLAKIYTGLNDPDYNYLIRSAPIHESGLEYLHWYVSIVPRVTRSAGFELGSGMFINTALPEESAAFLRSVDGNVDARNIQHRPA
ncbi:MAG: DUF4931 domain-containing protein [Caldilineae bacterium]|nr:MAG: DUF4931 domain-containing protein [Caldilineae bacterium]